MAMHPSSRQSRLLVLAYHNIGSTWRFPVPGHAARKLALQLHALKRVANIVPLEPAVQTVMRGGVLPRRAVAITLDDGYRDNLTLGVPVLSRLGVPATVFLVPEFLSRQVDAWWERLAWALARAREHVVQVDGVSFDLRKPDDREAALGVIEGRVKGLNHRARLAMVDEHVSELNPEGTYPADELFLDWDGARDLMRAGLTVGSHTMEHAILARESADDQWADLNESREILERELQIDVRTVAYPNGTSADYDDITAAAAKTAGYDFALTTTYSLFDKEASPYEICRRVIDPNLSPARLAAAVVRDFARAGRRDRTGLASSRG